MADKADIDLVAAVLTGETARAKPKDSSEYSWGAVSALVPSHARARASAFAVVDALRGAGRLVSAGRLAEFGRYGWAYGFIVGVLLGTVGERYDWSNWLAAAVGWPLFAAGLVVAGVVARRSVGRDGGRRG